jgi:hypothetical protein
MQFTAHHRSIEFTHRVPAPPATVFPLLCPVRERDWVDHWEADVLHSNSGVAELGCVFVTGAGPERDTFVVSRYEPPHAIEFVILSDGFVQLLQIELQPVGGATTLTWRRTYTALSPTGNAWIEANVPERALARMGDLDRMLRRYVEAPPSP